MGLFDFLKRKSAPQPDDEGPRPDYVFAHFALRQLALVDPLRFLALVASPDAEQFFAAVLKDVADRCGSEPSFSAADIKVHPTRVKSYPCAILQFPAPQNVTDVFMVGVLVPVAISDEPPADMKDVPCRYFTLERGFSQADEPRTVLAEWDTQTHSNHGDGPPADPQAFAAALSEHV